LGRNLVTRCKIDLQIEGFKGTNIIKLVPLQRLHEGQNRDDGKQTESQTDGDADTGPPMLVLLGESIPGAEEKKSPHFNSR
jgi:hypothetical protein